MMATSVVWYIVAVVLYLFKPEIRFWLLFLFPPLDIGTILAMVGLVLVFCVLCISLLHSVSYGSMAGRNVR